MIGATTAESASFFPPRTREIRGFSSGAKFVVENHYIDIELGTRRGKAGQLAAADEGRRIGLLALLQHAQHHRRTGGVTQTGELLE